MNKNYYEILQVDKNASKEIIDKVYKTLAKKYHPDLHSSSNKSELESILKEINEAYETLSDPDKRKLYDDYISTSYVSKEEYNRIYNENIELKNKLNNLYTSNTIYNHIKTTTNNTNNNTTNNTTNNTNNNTNYKNNYKRTFEDYIKNIFTLFITILILYLVIKIPFVHNLLTKNLILQKILK